MKNLSFSVPQGLAYLHEKNLMHRDIKVDTTHCHEYNKKKLHQQKRNRAWSSFIQKWMSFACLFDLFVLFVCFFCGGKGLYYKEFIYYIIFIYITLKFFSGCKHPVDSTRQHQVRWADVRSCCCLYSVASMC